MRNGVRRGKGEGKNIRRINTGIVIDYSLVKLEAFIYAVFRKFSLGRLGIIHGITLEVIAVKLVLELFGLEGRL